MSHFSTIKTKLKDKSIIIECLERLGERVNVPWKGTSVVELVITNPSHAEEHPTMEVDIAIGVDIGFRLNEKTGEYELVADRQTWEKDIPIERFLEKLTQLYCIQLLTATAKSEGFEVESQIVNDNNAVELTVTRWT